jgi:flagellar basal body-associated protein FliL
MNTNPGWQQQYEKKERKSNLLFIAIVVVLVLMGAGVLSLAAVVDWVKSIF